MASYKHLPENYSHIPDLHEDLVTFYKAYEVYLKDKSFSNESNLKIQGYQLHFTIKHRALDGLISSSKAEELMEDLGELYND